MNTASTQMRAAVFTLGCRLNQSESALLRQRLALAGYQIVPFDEPADLGIINTCTVTREADAKSRKAVRSFIGRNPGAYVAVVGCYSQLGYKQLSEIEGVDLIVGTQEKLNVLDYARQGKNEHPLIVRDAILRDDFTIEPAAGAAEGCRANLKVQDGCDFMCSFCVIPFARGRARSRDFDNLLHEARTLAGRGVKEIVLTGVNIGTYAHKGRTIVDVVDALDRIDGVHRVRISSIEPTTVPFDLLDRMRDSSHALVPHLHLPIQSGSDHVLSLMRRRYTRSEIRDFVNSAVDRVPEVCIGTDILVGMPGEHEEDLEQTCALLTDSPFAYAHVFKYSEREGTASVRLPGRVSAHDKDRRSALVRRISGRKLADFHARFEGLAPRVLFERCEGGLWSGYTENYIRVAARSSAILVNELRRVALRGSRGDFMIGTILDPDPGVGGA